MKFARYTLNAIIAIAGLAAAGFVAGCGGGGEVDPQTPTVCAYACCIDAHCPSGNTCYSNACVPSWSKSFGGNSDDTLESIIQTSDGGFFTVGHSKSFSESGYQGYALKLDTAGKSEWFAIYGGTSDDFLYETVQDDDGSFIAVGTTNSYDATFDSLLLKLNRTDGVILNRIMEDSSPFSGGEDRLFSIDKTKDGGYIVAGYTKSTGAGQGDGWIVKYSSALTRSVGDSDTFGDPDNQLFYSVKQASDGGYIMGGSSDGRAWVLKSNSSGVMEWETTVGDTGDTIFSVIQLFSGGYAAVGTTISYGTNSSADFLIIRLDSSGNILWRATYGDKYRDEAYRIIETSDRHLIVVGSSYPGSGPVQSDVDILKLDRDGKNIWIKRYGTAGSDTAKYVSETAGGGLIICGLTNQISTAAPFDAWVLRTDPAGRVRDLAPLANNIVHKQPVSLGRYKVVPY